MNKKNSFLALICSVFFVQTISTFTQGPTLSAVEFGDRFEHWENLKRTVVSNLPKIHGWCTEQKALDIMNWIQNTKPKVCVEIGVFGGSSIYPIASTLKFIGAGKVFAIDSWNNEDYIEGYEESDPNYKWWKEVNLEQILREFHKMLRTYKLEEYCKIMRMSSQQAIVYFNDESIDFLHIDGNHSNLYEETVGWYDKVKVGGLILFDDTSWLGTRKAVHFLKSNCELLIDHNDQTTYALFRKTHH